MTEQLQTYSGQTLPDPDHNAKILQQVAQDSYPLPPALTTTLHLIVQQTLSQVRFLTDNQKAYRQQLSQALAYSAFFGITTSVVGVLISAIWDVPSGPAIVLLATAIFFAAVLFSPKRVRRTGVVHSH